MSQDPYRPPEAPLRDVETQSSAGLPLAVANGIRLLWIDVGLTVMYFGWAFTTTPAENIAAATISAAIGIGLSVFLVLMLQQRRAWARYVMAALVGISLLGAFGFNEETPAMEYVFYVLMLVVEVLALALLFSKPAQHWFLSKR